MTQTTGPVPYYRWGRGIMTTNIKLYGSKSARFREIKEEMAEQLGYEPSNAEVAGLLMASYSSERRDKHPPGPLR